jgi:hypothetical protein
MLPGIILFRQKQFIMEHRIAKQGIKNIILFFVPSFLLSVFFLVCSFTAQKFADDFLKQLGITKQGADEKIANSILGGYLDSYGVKNARNIATGDRKSVTIDLLNYVKKYVGTPEFLKQYSEMRERYKPVEERLQTPEEMRSQFIADRKKGVEQAAQMLAKADASYKSIFEKTLANAKQALKDVEDPNNKYFVSYSKNYPQLVKTYQESHDRAIAQWNSKYPQNQLLFVKKRLEDFLQVTNDIDFSAELLEKNGKKIFVKPEYERKDNRWKMAFRAGKEVVNPSRDFVQKWMEEIK